MTRDKRNCMHLGTGLCPRGEKWAANGEPCDDCEHFLTRDGERGSDSEGEER